jgi:DNA polymerase beta
LADGQNGVSWRIIHELLKFGFSTELESVTDETRAAIMINRVHGFGKIRALAL